MAVANGEARCLHELFEAQADLRPCNEALICGTESLSYGELERQANQLAHYLRALGLRPGMLVGLYFERSARPIVAVLATLKAGAGYVPIDPNYPMQRVRHILADANIALLLTEKELSARATHFYPGPTVLLDGHAKKIAEQPDRRLLCKEIGLTAENLSYVIYTSGTTGRPKGIMTEHRNAVNFVTAFNEVCRMDHTDRIYQGFSLGFDGSVEEIWMAFSNGAALVVGTKDVVRFGSEVARLLTEKRVTYFSTVPTFLSMLEDDLPTVRLLVVSAEPCPPELVTKWATPNRRMLNVYGPTEATVNTTAAECAPRRPVTIGRPLPSYETYVLDEQLRPVPPGNPGELCVGGSTLARGYLGQPELTADRFIANPFRVNGNGHSPRLYRTGDLVRLNDEGELEFIGRIDGQVKIRGFRVELSEVEAVLAEHPQVRAAAVRVFEHDGTQELAAHVVANGPAAEFDRNDVLDLMQKRLPTYMVPAYLDLIDKLPTLTSGKIDRKSLPKPCTPLVRVGREIVEPETKLECQVTEIWEEVFKVSPISVDDDFFFDLGGYSLLAAQVVSLLRNRFGLEVAIRDVYQHTTVRQLAAHLSLTAEEGLPDSPSSQQPADRRTSREAFKSIWFTTRWCCVALQAISLVLIYGLAVMPMVVVLGLFLAVTTGAMASAPAVWIVAVMVFGAVPAMFALSVVSKWLIIGRYKPGKYPVWGFYYFRWWLASRLQALSGIGFFAGTPIMSLYYWLMGTKIGRNCIIDTPLCVTFDLVTIGDDTCIGAETQLLGYRVEDGMLILGTVEIGSRCFVGIHSALGLNTRMGDDARLDDLSLLPDGQVMGAGETRRGSPAQPAEVTLPEITEKHIGRRHSFLFGMIHFLLAEALGVYLLITSIPSLLIVTTVFLMGGFSWAIASLLVAVPVHVVWFCLSVAGIKAIILPRLKPGVYHVEDLYYLRIWMMQSLLRICRGFLHPLYTTIYLPPWLRLMGARVGRRAEISTVSQATPDLIVIEDESFFADGSMIGGRHFYRGYVEFAVNRIGRRSFVGNNAILPIGSNLGENCLLGVLSIPPANLEKTPDGSEWLGAPSFRLPYRQKVGGFADAVTYRPTVKLYLQRLFIDAVRVLLPYYLAAAGSMAFVIFLVFAYTHLPYWVIIAGTPLVALGTAVGTALCVVVIKRLLLPPFEPVIKPLWSTYVWWNEVINGVYETVAAPALVPLLGTPFVNWYLRLLGCKIGKHVFMETTLFSEFDLVDIGDYAALNFGVVAQNHLFEDRIMKSSHLRIGDNCSVGNMSVVLYDTEMQQGASIGPLSLLMKGETISPFTRWIGIPTSALTTEEDSKPKTPPTSSADRRRLHTKRPVGRSTA